MRDINSKKTKKKSKGMKAASVTGNIISMLIKTVFMTVLAVVLIAIFTGSICLAVFWNYYNTYVVPEAEMDLSMMTINETSILYYIPEDGGDPVEIERLHATENRIWVGYDKIPEHLKNAIIAIEDERFWTNSGVDWKRVAGAGLNYFSGSQYGGSTITQQLIKNVTGDDDVTIDRKIREIARAMYVNDNYSKKYILEMYLNIIHLGSGCDGVQSASLMYFGKDVSELDLVECASLAGITQNPVKFNPLYRPENNKVRTSIILGKMLELGMISESEYNSAMSMIYSVEMSVESLTRIGNAQNIKGLDEITARIPQKTDDMEEEEYKEIVRKYKEEMIEILSENLEKVEYKTKETSEEKKTSYFVDLVISEVLKDLQEKGYSKEFAGKMLYAGGLRIYTTLDPKVQKSMEDVFFNSENFPDITAKGKDGKKVAPEASMIILDPETAEIKGIVGGREKVGQRDLNRASQSPRQPGSTVKPIAVYAPLFDTDDPSLRITAASVFDDTPLEINEKTGNPWPKNYYTGYRGLMNVRKAIELSENCIPVKLVEKMGVEKSFNFLTINLGITTLYSRDNPFITSGGAKKDDMYLPCLALGGMTKGITTLELAGAYNTFNNEGKYIKPHSYTLVKNVNGTVILEKNAQPATAMKKQTADLMTVMLKNVVDNGNGSAGKFREDIAVAGKTGTTEDNCDRWFAGYTPYYTAVVWFGYDLPKSIQGVSGNPAAKLWNVTMKKVHEDLKGRSFSDPNKNPDLVVVSVCTDSGQLPNDSCRLDPRGNRIKSEYFIKGTEPKEKCKMHIAVEVCNLSGKIAHPGCSVEGRNLVAFLNLSIYPLNDRKFRGGYALPELMAEGEQVPSGYTSIKYYGSMFVYANTGKFNVDDAMYTYMPLSEGYKYPIRYDVPIFANMYTGGFNVGFSNSDNNRNYRCTAHSLPPIYAQLPPGFMPVEEPTEIPTEEPIEIPTEEPIEFYPTEFIEEPTEEPIIEFPTTIPHPTDETYTPMPTETGYEVPTEIIPEPTPIETTATPEWFGIPDQH